METMMIRVMALFIVCLGIFVAGCGGPKFKTGHPWDPKEASFFDDGIDIVQDVKDLSGKWAFHQGDKTEGRVQLADLIAEVEVMFIRTMSGMNTETSKHIEVKVIKYLHGKAPAKTVTLISNVESPGYELVLRYERHLTGRFILFVRWFEGENETLHHHFHLAPASDEVTAFVKARIGARKKAEKVRIKKKKGRV